jgi:hypothetical protein
MKIKTCNTQNELIWIVTIYANHQIVQDRLYIGWFKDFCFILVEASRKKVTYNLFFRRCMFTKFWHTFKRVRKTFTTCRNNFTISWTRLTAWRAGIDCVTIATYTYRYTFNNNNSSSTNDYASNCTTRKTLACTSWLRY